MRKNEHRNLSDFLALLVFGIFALCVAAVLLTGAGGYKRLTDRGADSYDKRVAVRYLTTRFHQAPNVRLEDFSGMQAMTVREEIGGRVYVTRVYCYDGYIRELFAAESTQVQPGDGEILLAADELAFSVDDGLLTAEITHLDGVTQQLFLWMPQWKEAAP